MGGDAEYLRSRLVSEIDLVRAADEGLAQQGPLGQRDQGGTGLTERPAVPGFAVWGRSCQPRGVLAGDWWNVTDREMTIAPWW